MFEPDELYKNRSFVPKLKVRQAYQVGYQIYKTPRGAASKVAWSWIMAKYNNNGNRLEGIVTVAGLECGCYDDDGSYFISDECTIHNHKVGYFKRLHDRCTLAILKEWSK